jgi:hypothetical protein
VTNVAVPSRPEAHQRSIDGCILTDSRQCKWTSPGAVDLALTVREYVFDSACDTLFTDTSNRLQRPLSTAVAFFPQCTRLRGRSVPHIHSYLHHSSVS